MTIITHPTTAKRIDAYLQDMPHALLVTGVPGVGASTIAKNMASRLSNTVLTVLPEKDDVVDLEKGTITVELVRRLYEQTRTKTERRVIIIDYAERMAPQAQNAFLKLLEEPTPGVIFLLVTQQPQKLLPTVRSRTQVLEILPVNQKMSAELLDTLEVVDTMKRTQLLYMASGLPAELSRLAAESDYFDRKAQIVRDARDLLQAEVYQKLKIAHKYKDNREGCLLMISVSMKMIRQAMTASPQPTHAKQLRQLLSAYDSIGANGNIRLQLAHIVL